MKCNHYVLFLSMLLSVVFFLSCQTDLVTPQTDNVNRAVSQNLTVPNDDHSFSSSLQENESDNESPIIGKIVARRDRPETWDDLGDITNIEYYNRVFSKNPEVQAIVNFSDCGFTGIVVSVEDEIISFHSIDNPNGGGIQMYSIPQKNNHPTPTCIFRILASWFISRPCSQPGC